MATESTFVYDESFIAGEDLSSAQYYAVSSSAAGYVVIATSYAPTSVLRPIGVLLNNPSSGQAATVRLLGKTKWVASSSGSCTVGAFATVASSTAYNGRCITATTGMFVLGPILSASTGVAGSTIEVLLSGGWAYQAGATA